MGTGRINLVAKRTLSSLPLSPGATALVRVDFNIPIEQGIEVISSYDQRLRATLPTIRYLLDNHCKVVLCSHLGRPGGKVVEGLRLGPVGDRLATLLDHPVKSLNQCVGLEVEREVAAASAGDVLLLENLRFHPEEEANDDDFSQALARIADFFVMDAFAVAHRAHASTVGLPTLLPSAMGMLLEHSGQEVAGQQVIEAIKQVTGTRMESQAAGRMGHSTSEVGDLVCEAL